MLESDHTRLSRARFGSRGTRPCASADRPSSFDGWFDYGRIVHWKADRSKRMLGTCPNRVIDPVNAARSMTAASTLQRLARSAALNASCAARPSRIGTPPGCLDIGSSLVQLRNPNDCLPSALGTPASSQRLADEPACPAILDSPVAFLESPQDYPENIPCMAMSGASSDRAELYLGQPVEWWCGHRHRRHADQSDYIYIGRAGSFEYDDGCELSDAERHDLAYLRIHVI